MLRYCEGTAGPDGYRTLFGGKLFDSFDTHPNVKTPFKQTDGQMNYSTAAGAYQILYRTWLSYKDKLQLTDFSPESQDLIAIQLIIDVGAIDLVMEGRLQAAIDKCARIWASLPSTLYPQPHRDYAYCEQKYTEAGGTVCSD